MSYLAFSLYHCSTEKEFLEEKLMMKKIIDQLEQKLTEAGISILEKRFDGFAYSVAVESRKGEYVIYFTKSFVKYRAYKRDCLKVMYVTKHIPFDRIKPINGRDFIWPYVRATVETKCAKALHDEYFSSETAIAMMT